MKMVTIIGARPQFIKAAMISRILKHETKINEVIVHTGQHYDANMSQIFFKELEIPSIAYDLGIHEGSHGKQTGHMVIAIETVLENEKPDWIMVYGDTNSTLAGALAAAKLNIPIAHIEAGLRSFNRKMPEEINRIIADHLSDILFTGTAQSVENLKREGFASNRIVEVGDVMYDAALFYGHKAESHSAILKRLNLNKYVLATIHRAENTNHPNRLLIIFNALEKLNQEIKVVIPLHPRTRKIIETNYPEILTHSKILILEPIGYFDMIVLEKHATLILTDSGGIQKEAFFYQIPCITLRDETEWIESVQLGWNRVVPPVDANELYSKISQALGTRGLLSHPYGKGDAAHKIVQRLKQEVC